MMVIDKWLTMTPQEHMDEVGTEPDCPFCGRARVTRSTYIRCHHCGKNWSEGQDIFKHPHIKATSSTEPEENSIAQPASAIPDGLDELVASIK